MLKQKVPSTELRAELDRFHALAQNHRRQHRCGGYPFEDGAKLMALAQRVGAQSVLELGTAVGYSAFSFASAGATVTSIDGDAQHHEIASELLTEFGVIDHVQLIEGDFGEVVEELDWVYDLVFVDGYEPDPAIAKLVASRASSLLVTANMSWASTRQAWLDELSALGWTHECDGDLTISAKGVYVQS